jgi:hypothetical protein
LSVIQLAIILVTNVGVSFRATSKMFIHLNLYLHLNIGMPTHTTILNWTKKQGISHFQEPSFYLQEKWVLIVDESIQFGNKKLLLILAVPEHKTSKGKSLRYQDITPLVLKVSESWKSENIVSQIKEHIKLEQIAYCISDTGSNLVNTFNTLNCTYIPDVNHKFSLIIQSVLGKNCLLDNYTKALSLIRAQKSMSKIARIVPPNQRIMSRFMNLTPLFEWGIKMLQLLDKNELKEDEKQVLSFLEEFREFILDTYQILITLNHIQKILKTKGYCNKTKEEALSLFSNIQSENSLKIRKQINIYFEELTSKAEGKTICCSSDIIESCFGKYKEIVKGNKTVGISDLSLCIAAMIGINNLDKTKDAMEKVTIKKLKEWKTKNIAKTLFAEKTELNKKIVRNYSMKK